MAGYRLAIALAVSVAYVTSATPACTEGTCSGAEEWPVDTLANVLIQTKKDSAALVKPHKKMLKHGSADLLLGDIQKMDSDYKGGALPKEMKDAVDNFRDLIKDSLLPNLKGVHDDAKTELASLLASVKAANDNATAKLEGLKPTKTRVDTARTNHTTCRNEGAEKRTSTEACDDLKSFQDGIVAPASRPSSYSKEEWTSYITTMSDFWSPKKALWESKLKACADEEGAAANHTAKCNHMQSQFELYYCDWRTKLLDTCSTFSTTYENAKNAYETKETSVRTQIPSWKNELTAIKKIECYLDTWVSESDASDTKTKCENLKVNTTEMDVTFGTVPTAGTCDTSPVSEYPGSSGFKAKEYGNFDDKYLADITACPESDSPAPPPAPPPTNTTGRA
eukprot:gnl/TRDRNA2_/TRDRNA2_176852_c0_seq5.p1 gnl/TRDRNA2_/TRDRNA2_176852_c0~~gnl/TRDRNA2_/TRDRNA2_176852_c0_seq5.p1  ORF type:complete len:394 (-),score=79.45 gnl/TRDRNA2_/TRDRNA2_176852_c0_seq5:329-1510(-)